MPATTEWGFDAIHDPPPALPCVHGTLTLNSNHTLFNSKTALRGVPQAYFADYVGLTEQLGWLPSPRTSTGLYVGVIKAILAC